MIVVSWYGVEVNMCVILARRVRVLSKKSSLECATVCRKIIDLVQIDVYRLGSVDLDTNKDFIQARTSPNLTQTDVYGSVVGVMDQNVHFLERCAEIPARV